MLFTQADFCCQLDGETLASLFTGFRCRRVLNVTPSDTVCLLGRRVFMKQYLCFHVHRQIDVYSRFSAVFTVR